MTHTDGETTQNYLKTKRSKKNHLEECDSILSVIGKQLTESISKPNNKFDLIGKTWANKLSEINKEQIIHAEKLIDDVLFEAQLGNLNRHCTLSIRPNQPNFDTTAPLHSSTGYLAQPQRPFRQPFSFQEYPHFVQPVPNVIISIVLFLLQK